MNEVALIYCPFPDPDSARNAAHALLGQHLVACCNLLPEGESLYWWEGAIATARETILIAKTTPSMAASAEAHLIAIHPYTRPAVLILEASVNPAFAQWVDRHAKGAPVPTPSP